MKILVINGVNLNLLGVREPQHYGSTNLQTIEQNLRKIIDNHNHSLTSKQSASLDFFQSNHEGILVDKLQQVFLEKSIDKIIFNPAAFTHTSVALRDTMAAIQIPFVEVHLSNIHRREQFRKHSYFSDLESNLGVICGFGAKGYEMALQFLLNE